VHQSTSVSGCRRFAEPNRGVRRTTRVGSHPSERRSTMRRKLPVLALLVAGSCVLVLALGRGTGPGTALAASHREAPLISLDAPADISDFFMFRSYEPGHEGNVILIMDTNPGEEPSSGPNYYNFDPNVTYRFRIDNDQDGRPNDIAFEFKFQN